MQVAKVMAIGAQQVYVLLIDEVMGQLEGGFSIITGKR